MPKFSKNNAIKILKSFSKQEIRAFEQYFKRLYPEKEVTLEVFYLLKRYHQKHYPNFPKVDLNREKVAEKLYGNYKNRVKKLNENLFQLAAKFREFLLWDKLKENTFERDVLECQIFEQRNMPKFTESLYKKMEARLPEKVGLDYHFERFRLTWAKLETMKNDRSQEGSDLLQDLIYQSDIFYFGLKANLFCGAISRERVLNHAFDYSLKDSLFTAKNQLDYLRKTEYLNIYSALFELMQNPDELLFRKVFENYQMVYQLFGRKEQSEIFSILQNIIGQFSFVLEIKGAKMIFKLYKFGLESGVILQYGVISILKYTNIVNTCCRLKEVAWMESFIYEYQSYLPLKEKNEVFSYVLIRLNFEKEKYAETIQLIDRNTFKNTSYNLTARVFKLKAFIELYYLLDIDLVESQLKLLTRFLNRNEGKVSERTYDSHKNFIVVLNQLVSKKVEKGNLLKNMENIGLCAYSEWLIEKIKKFG